MLFDDAKHFALKLTFVAFFLAKVKYKFWIKSILWPCKRKSKSIQAESHVQICSMARWSWICERLERTSMCISRWHRTLHISDDGLLTNCACLYCFKLEERLDFSAIHACHVDQWVVSLTLGSNCDWQLFSKYKRRFEKPWVAIG